jgi:hypothetical protein
VATELRDDEARDQMAHRHLQAALVSLVVSVLGAAALGLVLGELGYSPDLCLLAAWVINLNTARHLGKAAQAQRRNAWLYGIAAATWPAIAMAVLGYLYCRVVLPRKS